MATNAQADISDLFSEDLLLRSGGEAWLLLAVSLRLSAAGRVVDTVKG